MHEASRETASITLLFSFSIFRPLEQTPSFLLSRHLKRWTQESEVFNEPIENDRTNSEIHSALLLGA